MLNMRPIPETKMPSAATGGFSFKFDKKKYNASTNLFQSDKYHEAKLRKYNDALISLPQRGGGLHGALMGVANLGVFAGLSDQQINDELKNYGRAFRRGEIEEAIKEARRSKGEHSEGHYISTAISATEHSGYEKISEEKKAIFMNYIRSRPGIDPFGGDIWEASNPRPSTIDPIANIEGSQNRADMILFLSSVYKADDILYIGNGFEKKERQAEHVKPAAEWITFFNDKLQEIENEPKDRLKVYRLQDMAKVYPFIIINPLNGKASPEGSYRSGRNVKEFRYILFEIDQDPNTGEKMPLSTQLSIMSGLRLTILSLVYTGSKSIHAIVDLEKFNKCMTVTTREEWNHVKESLKEKNKAFKIGFDEQAFTPERLSRLPGIWLNAPDKGITFDAMKWQQLLYVNFKGDGMNS